jgi:hypothetical protein
MISGIHSDASFALTPTNTTVKVVFAIALYYLQQLGPRATLETLEQIQKEECVVGDLFDVVQSFLNSELDPEKNPLYIHLPPYWKEYCELQSIPYHMIQQT